MFNCTLLLIEKLKRRCLILAVNNLQRRGARSSYADSQQDLYTSLQHNHNGGFIPHSYSTGDLIDFQRQDSSVPQTPMTRSGSEIHLIKETPPEEKKRIFR